MLTAVNKRQTTGTATRAARYAAGRLHLATEKDKGGDMARSTYPSLSSVEALFTDVSAAQASVCEKSGEAGAANMEAAGLNETTQWWGCGVSQPQSDV
jgi:hypothetical protein